MTIIEQHSWAYLLISCIVAIIMIIYSIRRNTREETTRAPEDEPTEERIVQPPAPAPISKVVPLKVEPVNRDPVKLYIAQLGRLARLSAQHKFTEQELIDWMDALRQRKGDAAPDITVEVYRAIEEVKHAFAQRDWQQAIAHFVEARPYITTAALARFLDDCISRGTPPPRGGGSNSSTIVA